jgi:GT2 family glycosyltransferase
MKIDLKSFYLKYSIFNEYLQKFSYESINSKYLKIAQFSSHNRIIIKILWIDSDIIWKPEDVIKLYKSDKDIIAGAYYLHTGEVAAYPKFLGPGYTIEEVKSMDEVVEIDGTGFGFLCVKSGVFESLSRPWFQQSAVNVNFENQDKPTRLPIMGEDMSWCHRVKQAGFKIWFDPKVKVTHHKMIKLTWEG